MARAALFPGLNQAILQLAPCHTVRDLAPNTYRAVTAAHSALGHYVVWAGAADQTIYADPRVNYAFRAWHDACHLRISADFTTAGEALVAKEQCRELRAAFPNAPIAWEQALRADVLGVTYQENGETRFIIDQYAAVAALL